MKGYFLPIIAFLFLFPISIFAQSSDGNSSTLKVIVHDHYTQDLLDNAWVSLYHHGEIVDSVLTNQAGEALFSITTTSLSGYGDQIPQEFTLSPNFPNPFLQDTRLELGVPTREQISVEVYNVLGQRVSIHTFEIMPGIHTLAVSLGNLSTGVYFLRMTGGQMGQKVVKMTKTGLGHATAGPISMAMNAGSSGKVIQASLHNASDDYRVYTRKESYETAKVDLGLSADITIEVPLERLNRIVVNVVDEFSEQVQKNITVTGVDFETSFFSPDTLILKSGIYNLTASADETSELNQEFEIVSRDTTLKLIVERSTTATEMVVFPDSERAVSRYIDSEGGSITAIAKDGTEYILEIPKDALHENTLITLAPVASIEGYPFAETPFGVGHLEPDGLRLFKPANLTIIPQGGYDLDEFVTFAYDGMGTDFHFYPMSTLTETAVSFQIMSFSGYGGGNATGQEQEQQQSRLPSKEQARYYHEVTRHLNNEVKKMLKDPDYEGHCPDAETQAHFFNLHMAIFDNVIMPRLQAAETNDAILADAIREFLQWEADNHIYGPHLYCNYYNEEDGFHPEAMESIIKGLLNAIEKSHERCVDNFDPSEVSKMLDWVGISQLLGFDDMEAEEEIVKCLIFEVDFSSQIRDESEGSWNSYVRSLDIELILTESLLLRMWKGSKELEYVLYEDIFDDLPCDEKLIGTKNSIIDIELFMSINYDSTGTENQTIIDMIIDPGAPIELWEVHTEWGDCGSPTVTEEDWLWTEWFRFFHRENVIEDYREEPPGFKVSVGDWVTNNEGEIFAEKIIQREYFGITEDTRIYLRHAPKE